MKKTLATVAFMLLLIACEDKESDNYPLWTPTLIAYRGDGSITLQWYRPFYAWNFMVSPTSEPQAFEVYFATGSPDRMKKVATVKNTGNYTFTVDGLDNGSYCYAEVKATGYFMEKVTSNSVMAIPGAAENVVQLSADEDQSMESLSMAFDAHTLAYTNRDFTWNNGQYGNMALFAMDLNTHEKTIIDTAAYFPDWSPVDQKLIFCTDEHEFTVQNYRPQQIAIFDASSGTITYLTQGEDANYNPEFSPDGNWIVYSSDAGSHGSFEFWKMAADGSQQVQITNNLQLSGLNFGNVGLGRPVWSPDGNYIYFNRFSENEADMDIFRIPSNGGAVENVIRSPWNDLIPAVSPDHSKIAFISERSGTSQIWLYEPAEDRYYQVTGEGRFDVLTYWGKLEWLDGSTILFSGYERGTDSKYGAFTVEIKD